MNNRILFIAIFFFAVAALKVDAAPMIENVTFNKGNKVIKISHIYQDGEENELNRANLMWYIAEMSKELKQKNWDATGTILQNPNVCYVKIKTHPLQISFVVQVEKGEHKREEVYNRLKGDVVIEPTEMVELILTNLE